jgi:hypothetical protein
VQSAWTRRFAVESGLLLALAVAGAIVGWALAPALLEGIASWLDVGALFMTSPAEAALARLGLAVSLALPSAVAWIAAFVHRARADAAPPIRWLAVYVTVPWAAALAGAASHLVRLSWALDAAGTYEVEPILRAAEVMPASWAMRATVGAGVALWIAVAALAPRLRDRAAPPPPA